MKMQYSMHQIKEMYNKLVLRTGIFFFITINYNALELRKLNPYSL